FVAETTFTYPLSLHDALPIFFGCPCTHFLILSIFYLVFEKGNGSLMVIYHLFHKHTVKFGSGFIFQDFMVVFAGCRKGWPSHVVDRKSTRLNSSHVKISYAVF